MDWQPKWTRGPWTFDGQPMSRRTRYITRADGRTIGAAHSLGFLGSNTATNEGRLESDANAHLISAAPDLYAALDEAVRAAGAYLSGAEDVGNFENWLETARAALAKARGASVPPTPSAESASAACPALTTGENDD